MFKLVIQDDEGKTTVVPLIRDEITIGRKEGNTIRLTERNVSRRHARILRNNGDVQIEDLGSYNGIRVNNSRIAERVSLRVSDQVQIGDYKLYLKAEGVEQVDDSRTIPIERVDAMTEAMPPLSNQVPTAPMSVAPPGAAVSQGGLTSQQSHMVGNPNRTMVSMPDNEGRPVATAAAVAALTAPVGYGKLVVLSSNFAGKEFELSRPQMIIGRTSENDIVINHRSISRNHAKLVREPETGRYTVSDLQSSNGVRVNGQDYGKVELRRGDVVDLGHVRLRFVEAGEDFVFSRDAVITDVPETGKKRGLMIALLLGLLVIAGVVVVFVMKGGDKQAPSTAGGSDIHGAIVDGGSGAIVAIGSNSPGSDVPLTNPPIDIDAPSGHTVAAGAAAGVVKDCKEFRANRNWQELQNCADKLAGTGGAPEDATDFRTTALAETKAELAQRHMAEHLKDKDWRGAQTELKRIPDSSVYRNEAQAKFDDAAKALQKDQVAKAEGLARSNRCKDIATLASQAESTMTPDIADAIRKVPCTPPTAVSITPVPNTNPTPPVTNPVAHPNPPAGDCESPDDATKHAESQYSAGFAGQALTTLEHALACKSDPRLYRMAALYSCRAKNSGKAKQYYAKLQAQHQAQIAQACLQEGISLQ